jgi:predicted Zn-dependent protease
MNDKNGKPASSTAESPSGAICYLGRSQDAEPVLEELLRRHPANFDINETLGLIDAEAGDLSHALPLLEHAAHLQPRSAIARSDLGAAYLKLNQPRKAVPELEAAARLLPSDQQAQTNLAHAYMETGKPARAAQAFAAAAALWPLDADTTHDRALALLQSNDATGAKQVLDTIPQQSRDDATEELAGEAGGAAGRLSAGGRALLPGCAPESERAEHLCVGGGAAAPLLLAARGEGR